MTYHDKDPSTLITSLTYTDSLNVCGSFTYSLSNSNDTPYDATIFTFDPLTPSITLYSNDISKIGIYNLKLKGDLDSWAQSSTNLQITIEKSCKDAIITPYYIPN